MIKTVADMPGRTPKIRERRFKVYQKLAIQIEWVLPWHINPASVSKFNVDLEVLEKAGLAERRRAGGFDRGVWEYRVK